MAAATEGNAVKRRLSCPSVRSGLRLAAIYLFVAVPSSAWYLWAPRYNGIGWLVCFCVSWPTILVLVHLPSGWSTLLAGPLGKDVAPVVTVVCLTATLYFLFGTAFAWAIGKYDELELAAYARRRRE